VLLAVSVISYAGTFTQEQSKQGPQTQIQGPAKTEIAGSDIATATKKPAEKPNETVADGDSKENRASANLGEATPAKSSETTVSNDAEGLKTGETYLATAYSLRGRTASGKPVARGLIAADTSVLPLGSRVRLEAGSLSGEYVVADTGGAVKGRRVDIWTPTAGEAMRFGKRLVKLTVLSYGPRHKKAKQSQTQRDQK
jgi:3D (Asp-Asp-Asp) domain-containing protein